jgi:ribosome-binding protein aMBF1 (putative translation factor)
MELYEVGVWIASKRENKSISQEELSTQIGKTQSCIAKIEHGLRKVDILEFIEIVTFLNLTDEEILELFKRHKNDIKTFWS